MADIDAGEEFERVPGLFGAWDFGMLIEEGRRYLIEDGGRTDDGQPLFMVFVGQQPFQAERTRHDA